MALKAGGKHNFGLRAPIPFVCCSTQAVASEGQRLLPTGTIVGTSS
jgi:hypothetical protein